MPLHRIQALHPFNDTLCQVLLEPIETPMLHQAGQYLEITTDQGAAFYSIASAPNPEHLIELHIQTHRNNDFNRCLCDQLTLGNTPFSLQTPRGNAIQSK